MVLPLNRRALIAWTQVVGLLLAAAAGAHGGSQLIASRRGPGEPLPTLDGFCDEYEEPSTVPLLYGPRIQRTAGHVAVVATTSHLYLCISGLPIGLGATESFAGVYFDPRHEGGRDLRSDDLRFLLFRNGSRRAERGRGVSYHEDPTIQDWTAVRGLNFPPGVDLPSSWNAEFRIGLSLIWNGDPRQAIGASFWHHWVRFVGDDFVWPPRGAFNEPRTWADLLFAGFESGFSAVLVDQVRVTHGLETDLTSNTPYDYIAGKDVLVRARLYTEGRIGPVTRATCEVRRLSPPFAVQAFPAAATPFPYVNPYRAGSWNGSPTFECWVPGVLVESVGTYGFRIRIQRSGDPLERVVDHGARTFLPTEDLRLFFFPWEDRRPGAVNPRRWGSDLTANVVRTVAQISRIFPLRAGTAAITEAPPADVGLRFRIHPAVTQCPSTAATCTAQIRAASKDAFDRFNDTLRDAERRDGVPRDRLDEGSRLEALRVLPSGSVGSCGRTGLCGAFFDASDTAGTVVAHEIGHAMGQVRAASGNSDGSGSLSHSANAFVAAPAGLAFVNVVQRRFFARAGTLMFPFVPSAAEIAFHEAFEWNDLRRSLISRAGGVGAGGAGGGKVNRFRVVASISPGDEVSVLYSSAVDDRFDLSGSVLGSHELVLTDAAGGIVSRAAFTPDFQSADGLLPAAPVVLTLPLPVGATGWSVLRGSTILHSEKFSRKAPGLADVEVLRGAQALKVSWASADADTAVLRHNVLLRTGPGAPEQILASGVEGSSYQLPLDLISSASEAVVVVEVTDGPFTNRAESAPFEIVPRPPAVTILGPEGGARLVEGQPFVLPGAAWDADAGLLGGPLGPGSLSWFSNRDGFLGSGPRVAIDGSLSVALSPAAGVGVPTPHTITLAAGSPSGLEATAEVEVVVLPDRDGDAIPDGVELPLSCSDPFLSDSERDPDGDRLTSLDEIARGTDPCAPDSDGDGAGDGDEVFMGSNASDPSSLPAAPGIFLSTGAVDLGSCDNPVAARIAVTTSRAQTDWNASASDSWIEVAGGGPGDGFIDVFANCDGLVGGSRRGAVRIVADDGTARAVDVALAVDSDRDGDGVVDVSDNCLEAPNPNQADANAPLDDDPDLPGIQRYGDACDLDLDDDGVVGVSDFFNVFRPCLGVSIATRPDCRIADLDGDGVVAAADFFGGLRPALGSVPGPGITEPPLP